MRKIRICCILFFCTLIWNVCCSYAVPAAESCMTLDAQTALAGNNQLLPSAQAVVLYAPDSDTLVYSWNPDVKIDPSGMNKIMTAMIALETKDMASNVTVTSTALNSVAIGAVSAGLKAGECIVLRDLLYLMMVGSANDAAAVIAEYISGSQAAFVALMNQRSKEIGCSNTNFLNPTGLSAEGQYSTARDLAKITASALKDERFVELFSAVEHTVPATNSAAERKVITTNYMMSDATVKEYVDTRIIGGKTGALSTTDRSLISIAEKDSQQYLAVVMSAKSTMTSDGLSVRNFGNFSETKLLLDHAFSQYSDHQLLSATKVMTQLKVSNGENDLAVSSKQAVSALMPNDLSSELVTYKCIESASGLSAPVAKGDIVGVIEFWYNGICVAQSDLVAMHDVKVKGQSALTIQGLTTKENSSSSFVIILVVFLSVGILAIGSIIFLRIIHTIQHRKRNRRKRRRR